MRAMVAPIIVSLLVSLPAGCGRSPKAEQITKLAVVQAVCDPHCRSWGATLHPGDTADITGDLPDDDIHTHVFRETFATSAHWLAGSAFFTGKSDYRHDPDPDNSTYVTAWIGATERQVVIPSKESVVVNDRSLFAISRLVSFVAERVAVARNDVRARTKKRLANVAALTMVEYDAHGCFGTCPAYAVRFHADGHAEIDDFDVLTRARVNARADVPFATIVHVLQTSQFTELQRRYRVRVVDVFGAGLHLRYRDGFRFDSDAPDRTEWSDEFAQIAARLDQVVLDTQWTPPLPARRYRAP